MVKFIRFKISLKLEATRDVQGIVKHVLLLLKFKVFYLITAIKITFL